MNSGNIRITLQEASSLAGVGLSMLERAANRRELVFVFSGAARRVRTTPAWVCDWIEQQKGSGPRCPSR